MMSPIMAKPSLWQHKAPSPMQRWASDSSDPDRKLEDNLPGFARQAQREARKAIERTSKYDIDVPGFKEKGMSDDEKTKALNARFKVGSRVKGHGGFKIKDGQMGTVVKVEARSSGAIAYMVKLDSGGTVKALDSELKSASRI